MVLFNCKTMNISYANSSVGAVMCQCVIHSLWLGLASQRGLGQPLSLVFTHGLCVAPGIIPHSDRRDTPRICCIELKIAFTSEGVRSKVRERTSTKTERSIDKKKPFYILLRIIWNDNLILCDSKYLLLFSF